MWPNPQKTVDLVTVTEEILYGKVLWRAGVFLSYFEYVITSWVNSEKGSGNSNSSNKTKRILLQLDIETLDKCLNILY